MRAFPAILAASILFSGAAFAGEGPVPEDDGETVEERIERCIILLGSEIWQEREQATEALVQIGEPAVPALEEASRSGDAEVRMRASGALSRIVKTLRLGDRATKEELLRALQGLASANRDRRGAAWKRLVSASNLALLAKEEEVVRLAGLRILLEGEFRKSSDKWVQGKSGRGAHKVEWNEEEGFVRWQRSQASSDGGGVFLHSRVDVDVKAGHCLLVGGRFRIDHHDLKNSGWCSDEKGGYGEYPVRLGVEYLDEDEKPLHWTHGLLTCENSCRLRNYSKVAKGEWNWIAFDLTDPSSLVPRDPQRPEGALKAPMILQRVIIGGCGWDFAGAADSVRVVLVTFKDEKIKATLAERK